ncbi:hypothetical protein D3C75_595010 [compost metagenome]
MKKFGNDSTCRRFSGGIRKGAAALLGTSILISSLAPSAFAAIDPVNVIVNGERAPISLSTPYSSGGVTMVPMRFVAEKLEIPVQWDSKTGVVTLQKNGKTIVLTVGSSYGKVNGTRVALGAKVVRRDGTVMIPLRLVSEQMNANVKWEPDYHTVTITDSNLAKLKLDRFGRLIRTTNLPTNAKNYENIYADIPNVMYEYPKLYPLIDTTPNMFKDNSWDSYYYQNTELMRKWQNNAEEYFNQLLNVDYRTIGSEATWAQEMKSHRNSLGEIREMKEYVTWVKKNQIVTEGVFQAEPSILLKWESGGYYYIRSHFKFKIMSAKQNKGIFYDEYYDYYNSNHPLKFNTWYEGYMDMPVSTNVVRGDMYYVSGLAAMFIKFSEISKLKE